MRRVKLISIIIFIFVSAGAVHPHFTGRFFPAIPLAFFLIGAAGIGLTY